MERWAITDQIFQEWRRLETDELWLVRTAVVMPDHMHLVVRLGNKLGLDECIRLFKGRLSGNLRFQELKWQNGFYDHRIREASDLPAVFLYIFLNPYRAGLLTAHQHWPGYYCRKIYWKWFGAMSCASVPQPEWLR